MVVDRKLNSWVGLRVLCSLYWTIQVSQQVPFPGWMYLCLTARIWALGQKKEHRNPTSTPHILTPASRARIQKKTRERIVRKPYLRKGQCEKIWTYQAKADMRVLFVISFELKRSRKSPCLWVELVSFSSSSPAGITFRLNLATMVSWSIAFLGLLCARSQRGDSGKNLSSKIVQDRDQYRLENFPSNKGRGLERYFMI